MKLLPAVWLFPIVVSLPSLWIISCKGMFETTAKLTYLGKSYNWLNMMFRQICQISFFASIHYWCDRYLVKKHKFPSIFLNLFFYGIYLEIFGFGLYDFEFTRINMQTALPSIYTTYVGRFGGETKLFSEPLYNIKTAEIKTSTSKNIISDSIMDQPTFWISTLLFILFWLILQGVLVYIYKDFILASSKISIGDKTIIGGPVNIL